MKSGLGGPGWAEFGAGGARGHGLGGVGGAGYAGLEAAEDHGPGSLLIGSKSRIAGLTLRATDANWSHGTGPEVSGPILSLVMAMTGRKQADDDLAGEGVATLRSASPG